MSVYSGTIQTPVCPKTHPWRSIERVNATELLPGDSVWFQANQTFVGNLRLASLANVTAKHRVP